MKKHIEQFTILALGFALFTNSQAASLFEVTAGTGKSNGGPPVDIIVRGNDLPRLLDDVIRGQRQFSDFADLSDYTITVSCRGVANTLVLNVTSAFQTNAILYTITGPRNFSVTRASRKRLADEMVDQIKQNPRALIPNVNRSLVSVTDGNPAATTALMAEHAFDEFAFRPSSTDGERQAAEVRPDVGRINAGPFQGTTYTLPISYRTKLTERVSLAIGIPLNYTEIEDAKVYRGGLLIGFPVRLLSLATNQPWAWRITPSGGAVAGVSEDFAEGGLVLQGAFSSALSYQLPFCTLGMGNHFSFYETESIAGYNARVSQQIAKNGLKVGVPIGKGWVFETWGIHTHFVQTAALQDFYTVGGSLAYLLPKKPASLSRRNSGTLYLSLYAHLGEDYVAPHFRLGTEWKF